jgi:hypothetical protein
MPKEDAMAGNRYDRGWMGGRGYGREYGARRGPPGRGRYDAGVRGGYDRGWNEEMAYGREPGMMGGGPGAFTPFGWDPMMRWSGWDPLMGFVPYQDTPQQWSYGLEGDYQRYEHDYYRGNTVGGYGGDYRRPSYGRDFGPPRGYDAQQRGVPPRQSPLYGRGGDRALREWARQRGYDVEHIIRPRLPRR